MKAMKIGDTVKRNTTERGYQGTGTVIEIKDGRARVKWEDKRTWYAIARLIIVSEA